MTRRDDFLRAAEEWDRQPMHHAAAGSTSGKGVERMKRTAVLLREAAGMAEELEAINQYQTDMAEMKRRERAALGAKEG